MKPIVVPALATLATLFVISHVTCQGTAPDWTTLTTSNTPAGRYDHGVCYFETPDGIGSVLMQGGTVGATTTTDTWLLNTLTGAWTNATTTPAPSQRWDVAMAFDRARNRVVLFGGQYSTTVKNDTWEFDGTNWTQLSPATVPTARRFTAMAYDNARGVVVMFGGENATGSTRYNDTWEWNGTNWTQRSPSTVPSARGQHAMSFDLVRGVTVMTGGWPTPTDTWEWNGTNWTQRTNNPFGDYGHSMVYDAARQKTVVLESLFGTPSTFEWDGTNWGTITTTTTPGAGSWGNFMAYDEGMGVTVYSHGGFVGTMLYGTPTPASYIGFGAGCPGTGGYLPRLRAQTPMQRPWDNSVMNMTVTTSPGGSQFVFLNLGTSDTVWSGTPLPLDMTSLGAPGCFVWASADIGSVSGSASGGAITFPITFPSGLVGASAFFQAVVVDSINSLGLITSAGRRAIIGT
jgi:hypothetical protein